MELISTGKLNPILFFHGNKYLDSVDIEKKENLRDDFSMIYQNSNDPIEIKKISLRIWSLREQLEAIIEYHLKKKGNNNISSKDLQKIFHDYNERPIFLTSENSPEDSSNLSVDSSEDAKLVKDNQKENENENENENDCPLHLEVKESKVSLGVTLLSDITMDKIAFFSQKQFLAGQSVLIEFIVPNKFILNAEILYCKNYNMGSRILSSTRPKYRLIAKFTFQRPGERTSLRNFVVSIRPTLMENPPNDEPEKKSSLDL